MLLLLLIGMTPAGKTAPPRPLSPPLPTQYNVLHYSYEGMLLFS